MAVTEATELRVTIHAPVPEQAAPVQPVNVEPDAAVAVKVTTVLLGKAAEHVDPQLMPAGLLVTVPAPPPVLFTVKTGDTGPADKIWIPSTSLAANPRILPSKYNVGE